MAKTNNLTDFLTDVADAIREKEGSNAAINPQAFSSRILALQTGGGGGAAVPAKDVNFRDYDGTILHSYSKSAFLALIELPPLPSQDGLICQGWNWTFEDAKAYVQEYGVHEIGATYITSDGKTRYYITIADKHRADFQLNFQISASDSLVINWGDGNIESIASSGTKKLTHHYDAEGDYVIQMEVIGSAVLTLGGTALAKHYANLIKKVELGQNVSINSSYVFQFCYSLETITIPVGVTALGGMSFQYCASLKSIVIPINVSAISQNVFSYCSSLNSVSLPNGITKVNTYIFAYCYSLSRVIIPSKTTTLDTYALYHCEALEVLALPNTLKTISSNALAHCYSITKLILPNSVTTLSGAFSNCFSLSAVFIPSGVTNIAGSTFNTCSGLALVDFRTHTSVPTLAYTNAFSSIASDCKIVVPDELYDEWIAATNWSSVAKYIVKASEYNG